MDKINKFIQRLSHQERSKLKKVIKQVLAGDVQNLDTKKLKRYGNIFRVRVGDNRIIFKNKDAVTRIVFVGRKSGATYKKFR